MTTLQIPEQDFDELRNASAIAYCMLNFAQARINDGESPGDAYGGSRFQHPESFAFEAASLNLWAVVHRLYDSSPTTTA